MRILPLALLACLGFASPAWAQFLGSFDLGDLKLESLKEPGWIRRKDGDRLLYLCVADDRCESPTGIELKGVRRGEKLPEAFESGPLSPPELKAQGEANAKGTGAKFMKAEAFTSGGLRGIYMEAAAPGEQVYFLTRWIGRGDRMLDIKVTSPDLDLARELSRDAVEAAVPQVFGPSGAR